MKITSFADDVALSPSDIVLVSPRKRIPNKRYPLLHRHQGLWESVAAGDDAIGTLLYDALHSAPLPAYIDPVQSLDLLSNSQSCFEHCVREFRVSVAFDKGEPLKREEEAELAG